MFPYRPRFQPWSAAEARLFLHASRDHRLGALYALGLMTGMRRGEVLGLPGLTWTSTELWSGYGRHCNGPVGDLRLGPVKTDGSIRFVALPQPCAQLLQEHRRRQDVERAAAGDRWVETGLVFTTTTGSPLEPSNVNKAFAELSAAAGVGESGSMTCGTRAPRCCMSLECRSRTSRMCSGTRRR